MRYLSKMLHGKRISAGLILLAFSMGCSQEAAPKKKKKSPRKSIQKQSQNKSSTPNKIIPPKETKETKLVEKVVSSPPKADKPLPIHRPSDKRPKHDAQRLKKFGIHRYESKHLLLYTDIDPGIAKTLPPYIDAAYVAWEEYFGKLPPNREKTVFQMTGYIMKDKQLFKKLGLHPADLRPFLNGRHRGAEFWLYDQQYDYYRRHLMIHEATHCFMTIMPDVNTSVWYMEGMAELFGTHRVKKDGSVQFRIMPQTKEEVAGLGRISIIRDKISEGKGKFFRDVTHLKPSDYLKTEAYAWSWGLCMYLDSHPKYTKRFRKLGHYTTGSQFPRMFKQEFNNDLPDILSGWTLFAGNLQYGYDDKRSAITFEKGVLLKEKMSHQCAIQSNLGWQSSKLLVEKGKTYQISAQGSFTLAQQPKPWRSEANGISFRYFDGKPLGQLLAAIRIEKPATVAEQASLLFISPIGSQKKWKAPFDGTLYFRLNDSWSELADNIGKVDVTIQTAHSK